MVRRSRAVLAALGLAGTLLAIPAPAAAHAELLSTDPVANTSLTAAPEWVVLEFSEPVSADNAEVELLDARGSTVAGVADPELTDGGRRVRAGLPELEAGVYTVRFRIVSALDGHVTTGVFAFQVDPTGTLPPPALEASAGTRAPDVPTVVARWIGLTPALVLFGVPIFWAVAARPALALTEPRFERRGVWRLLATAGVAAFAGLAVFLALASRGLVTADPAGGHRHFALDFAGPFGTTAFANAMRLVEGATFLAFALALVRATSAEHERRGVRRPPRPERRGEVAALVATSVLGAAALAGYSFGGHVSAVGGPLFGLVDWAHLLSVGVWLGTLPGLLLLHVVYARRQPPESRNVVLGAAIRRHSSVALVAAPLVALTGIANSAIVVGEPRNVVASDYGNLVLAKGILFSAAIALGSANFFLLRRASFRKMLATVGGEVGVGALAVMVAATLGTTPPAATRPGVALPPRSDPIVLSASAVGSTVRLVVTSPSPGAQLFQAGVVDPVTGAYRTDLQKVFLVFTPPPGTDLPPHRVEATQAPAQPGLFIVSGSYTPVFGTWSVEVVLRRAGEQDVGVTFSVPVEEPPTASRGMPAPTGVGVPAPLAVAWSLLPPLPHAAAVPLVLFAAAGGAFVIGWSRTRRAPRQAHPRANGTLSRALPAFEVAAVSLGVVAALLVGSRLLLLTANAAPPEAAALANPIPATQASVERGARAYEATCAACHGPAGRGDGPTAEGLLPPPTDLTVATRGRSDGELYHWITNGLAGTSMPAFATELTPDERWDVVNYLRTLERDP